MAVPFSNTKLRPPRGFRNVLEGLSREVLRCQPGDIYAFGSLYFDRLLRIRHGNVFSLYSLFTVTHFKCETYMYVGGWLGSRVVPSVLDSGAEGPRFKSQTRRCLRQTVHTHCASVHQAAKLVAALLMVAGVTAGLAESNGSLPSGL